MQAEPFVSRVLDDEGLTEGLNDPEARILVEWLVGQAEDVAQEAGDEAAAWKRLEAVCRRARAIRRFVSLWYHSHDQGAAAQLAGAERFLWPLPPSDCEDPCEFLVRALEQEASYLSLRHAKRPG
jgi:hypothetical protein